MINDKKISQLVTELDKLIVDKYDEYLSLNEQLQPFVGTDINGKVDEVNRIVLEMQKKFNELYPALYFIGQRYQFGINITNSYTAFIQNLEKSGFTEEPLPKKEESKITS